MIACNIARAWRTWTCSEGVDGDDPFRDTSAQGSVSYRLSNTTLLRARLFGGDSFAKMNSSPLQDGERAGHRDHRRGSVRHVSAGCERSGQHDAPGGS